MRRIKITLALGLALLLTGLMVSAVSASSGEASAAVLDRAAAPTITPTITSTWAITHPVGNAIALYFGIPYTEVMALHAGGLGFGEIGRVYLTAQALSGTLTFSQVLELRESGMGWGQFMQQYGVHPGGKGLGVIMSGRDKPQPGTGNGGKIKAPPFANGQPPTPGNPSCPGNSCNAPGQNKPGKGPKK